MADRPPLNQRLVAPIRTGLARVLRFGALTRTGTRAGTRAGAGLIAAAVLSASAAPAQAQSAALPIISNTASAAWTFGGQQLTAASNTVTFSVMSSSAKIETFVPIADGGQSLSFTPSQCGSGPLPVAGGLTAATTIASIAQTSVLHIGETFYFRVVAAQANVDPNVVDSITTTLTTTGGDRETIKVFETTPNSGIFVGAVPTAAIPPAPVAGDCHLSVAAGDVISIAYMALGNTQPIAVAQLDVLADPFGLVFDSQDGSPVEGASVTLVDNATGAPAHVLAPDGVTGWPSTVVTGQPVTDTAGNIYSLLPGEYRFPNAPLGTYRVQVQPPAPYSAPSTATPAQLAGLTRTDGTALRINPGSYGGAFSVNPTGPVRVDIPLDSPQVAVAITKTASKATALPGDVVFYTLTLRNADTLHVKRGVVITDTPAPWLRFRPTSVRVDSTVPVAGSVVFSPDGRGMTIKLGNLAAGSVHSVTYAVGVRADAPPGQAINRASVTDALGLTATTNAVVRISRDSITAGMTLIGRITDGGCDVAAPHRPIPGVRVMLEDGSFAVTDIDGRYHFDALVPGTHVVQAAGITLPRSTTSGSGQFVDCTRSARSAGSPSSRFVIGQGGSLLVEDFVAVLPAGAPIAAALPDVAPASDREAAGAEIDWLAQGDGPTAFIFPAADHNPRAPAVRIVIRHRKGQTVDLSVDGRPVDKFAFDGVRTSAGGTFAVSIWRGVPLGNEVTRLLARVKNADGSVATTLARDVHFSATPARAELVAAQSRLTADGTTRPVLAVRILDRFGRPVHAGLTGAFSVNSPYESAAALDIAQSRALSGLSGVAPTWTVKGDDGVALVELAPTMVSGALHLGFTFTDGQISRNQVLDSWIVPGAMKWTLVGLAEGSVGARTIADNMERTGSFDSNLGKHARVAFYAKGRVLGRFLLTASYDSAKQGADQRLLGAIDPNAYYTVYADRSDRRFDAASRDKLYVRIEARGFYAIYGDFVTGFDQTQLARNSRTLVGVKAEGQAGHVHALAYAARTAETHRHDEIQGNGLTGPYRLSSRDMIANSEKVVIEVRDRFRSELIVSSTVLTRFTDYDIDMLSGTISFKSPVLSRDSSLNPQFIIADYDVDSAAGGAINAGLRADWTGAHGRVRVGATAITDTGLSTDSGAMRSNLGAVDVKAKIGKATELRAEAAVSHAEGAATANAWLVELEHHDGRFDVLAYARSAGAAFGLGQTSGAELGRRKVGADARYRFNETWSVTGSAWHDQSLVDPSGRDALELAVVRHSAHNEAKLGVETFRDTLATGATANSTVVDGSVTQRLLDNRLELTTAHSVAIGSADSVDLPQRHSFGLRYAVTPKVKLVGLYEIASGAAVDARTARVGFDLNPWSGAHLTPALGHQDIAEYGARSFAAFGLTQSLEISKHVTIDGSVDSARTLGGINPASVINPAQPVASGGQLTANRYGQAGSITEDFVAVTLGGTWRAGRWTTSLRGELRNGTYANRRGLTLGSIRQLGEGSVVGAGLTWTHAVADTGATSAVLDATVALANRPANSDFAFLSKIEYRADAITGLVAGVSDAIDTTALTTNANAQSHRLIGSVSANWTHKGVVDGQRVERDEIGIFLAMRHNFDLYDGVNLAGTTLLAGLDARFGVGAHIELGGMATVRRSFADHTTSFAFGPQIGLNPRPDMLLTLGYNIAGFRDGDFSAARTTNKGFVATLRMKFDAGSFAFLGLGR